MGSLYEELWIHVVSEGLRTQRLGCRELCSLSIVCRSLRHISNLNCFWKFLLDTDYPVEKQEPKIGRNLACSELHIPETSVDNRFLSSAIDDIVNWKNKYKERYEKVKASKLRAHRYHMLRIESLIAELNKDYKNTEGLIYSERQRLSTTLLELSSIERARKASVACKLWQPQIIRTRHQQIVEQLPQDFESRLQSLRMEVRVSREQLERLRRSLDRIKLALEKSSKDFESAKYQPMQIMLEKIKTGADRCIRHSPSRKHRKDC